MSKSYKPRTYLSEKKQEQLTLEHLLPALVIQFYKYRYRPRSLPPPSWPNQNCSVDLALIDVFCGSLGLNSADIGQKNFPLIPSPPLMNSLQLTRPSNIPIPPGTPPPSVLPRTSLHKGIFPPSWSDPQSPSAHVPSNSTTFNSVTLRHLGWLSYARFVTTIRFVLAMTQHPWGLTLFCLAAPIFRESAGKVQLCCRSL